MKLRPLPGNMFVKVEALYKDSGLVKIPERYKKAPHLVGRITALSMRPEDERFVSVKVGDRVIVTPLSGRHLYGDEWVYPITLIRKDEAGKKYRDTGVLAVIPGGAKLASKLQEHPRCRYCGNTYSGTEQNMLLFHGTCPRCGKNIQGEIPDDSLKLNAEEEAACERK